MLKAEMQIMNFVPIPPIIIKTSIGEACKLGRCIADTFKDQVKQQNPQYSKRNEESENTLKQSNVPQLVQCRMDLMFNNEIHDQGDSERCSTLLQKVGPTESTKQEHE